MGIYIAMLGVLAILCIAIPIGVYRFMDNWGAAAGIAAVVCVLISGLIAWSAYAVSLKDEHWVTCHVTSKDRAGGSSGSSHYRVYTPDCDTLGNEDSLFQWKWNSSNLWEQIEPGKVYQFRIVGTRSGFWDNFQNILEVKPAPAG